MKSSNQAAFNLSSLKIVKANFLKMDVLLEVGKITPADRFDFFFFLRLNSFYFKYILQMYVLMQFMVQIFLKQGGSQLNYDKRTMEFTNGSDFSFVVYILCLMPTTAVVFHLPPCNIPYF